MRIFLITIFTMFTLQSFSQGYIGRTKSSLSSDEQLTFYENGNNNCFKFITKNNDMVLVIINEQNVVIESIIEFSKPEHIVLSLNTNYNKCNEYKWISQINNEFNVIIEHVDSSSVFKFEQVGKNE